MKQFLPRLLAVLLLIVVFSLVRGGDFGFKPFAHWILALVVLLLTFVPDRQVSRPPPVRRIHFSWTVLIIIFLYSLRIILFSDPTNVFFHGDEAIISRHAQQLFLNGIHRGEINLLGSGEGTISRFPALWYFVQGFVIYVFGPSLLSIKLFSLFTDFLICLFGYLMVKQLISKPAGFVFALLYATFPISIHFSLTGYQNIQSTFFLIASIYCLFHFPPHHHRHQFGMVLTGLLTAFSFYFYLSAFVVPPIIIVSFLLVCIRDRVNFRGYISSVVFYLFGLLAGLVPFIAYSFYHYQFVLGRSSAFFIRQIDGNLAPALFAQAVRFVTGFLPSGFMKGEGIFYPGLPGISTWPLFLLFIVGIIYTLYRRNSLGITALIAIVVTSIFGGILTNDPPAAQRLIHLFPAIIIISSLGIEALTKFINSKLSFIRQSTIYASLLLLVVASNLYCYFFINLPTYHREYNQDVADISLLFIRKSSPLFFAAPVHKIDQIYYYSRGTINPIMVNSCQQLTISHSPIQYFLADESSLLLRDCPLVQARQVLWTWPISGGHITLYQLNY